MDKKSFCYGEGTNLSFEHERLGLVDLMGKPHFLFSLAIKEDS